MKRLLSFIAIGAAILLACHHDETKIKEFKTQQIEGKMCLSYQLDNEIYQTCPDENGPFYVKNTYSLVWPEKGMMTEEATKELITSYFGEDNNTDIEQAANHWLKNLWVYDGPELKGEIIDSIDEKLEYSYDYLESTCRQDSNLVTFIIKNETYLTGGAHGYYTTNYLTVDVEQGTIVHLADLVDTSRLSEAIAHAVQDLEVNKTVLECLYDEYRDADNLPVTQNFLIDSTRSTIMLVYQPYDIACYACGIQSIVLPIFWLSKHTALTPYAKRLFGPDCSLD